MKVENTENFQLILGYSAVIHCNVYNLWRQVWDQLSLLLHQTCCKWEASLTCYLETVECSLDCSLASSGYKSNPRYLLLSMTMIFISLTIYPTWIQRDRVENINSPTSNIIFNLQTPKLTSIQRNLIPSLTKWLIC